MKVLTQGHLYSLDGFENPNNTQRVQFIHKEKSTTTESDLVTISDGTTNEEVLAMMLNRMSFLQDKFPCEENAEAIEGIQKAISALERRTADRVSRGVEGKHEK